MKKSKRECGMRPVKIIFIKFAVKITTAVESCCEKFKILEISNILI